MKYTAQNLSNRHVKPALFAAVVVAFAFQQAVATGSDFLLTDGNATAMFNPKSEYGLHNFGVDGQDQLWRQTFFYGLASGAERNLSTLNSHSTLLSANSLRTIYTYSSFKIEVNYVLTGGAWGSGSATVGEKIKITNLTGSALDFHFFQYVDFDLGGNGYIDSANLVQDDQGRFIKAIQENSGYYFASEFVSPGANHAEVGLDQSILNKLNDDCATTLTDHIGPVFGDAVWGFQWDLNLAANESFTIDINKSLYLVPEPSSLAMVLFGAAAFAIRRRK